MEDNVQNVFLEDTLCVPSYLSETSSVQAAIDRGSTVNLAPHFAEQNAPLADGGTSQTVLSQQRRDFTKF